SHLDENMSAVVTQQPSVLRICHEGFPTQVDNVLCVGTKCRQIPQAPLDRYVLDAAHNATSSARARSATLPAARASTISTGTVSRLDSSSSTANKSTMSC